MAVEAKAAARSESLLTAWKVGELFFEIRNESVGTFMASQHVDALFAIKDVVANITFDHVKLGFAKANATAA